MPNVDPFLNAFTNGAFSEIPKDDDVPNRMERFRSDAALAGVIGWKGVEALEKSLADLNARAEQIFSAPRREPHEIQAASSPDSVIDDSHRLEKRYAGIHKGEKAARIEKSANGKWAFAFSADGRLIRGYEIESN